MDTTPQSTSDTQPRNDGKAIVSLICGVLSMTPFWILAGIPAIILGHISRSSIRKSMGRHLGYTAFDYDLRWTATEDLQSQKPVDEEIEVTIAIRSLNPTLSLKTTIYLPEQPPPHLSDHELGHKRIAEKIYETAEAHALRLAEAKLGKTFTQKGKDLGTARKAALKVAGDELCAEYSVAVRDEAQRVQEIYDELTDHGLNSRLREEQAIQLAFETRAKEKASSARKPGRGK